MYKYFLGTKSNLSTKKAEEPLVIETETSALHEIYSWLDKFLIDLDVLVQAVLSITKSDITKINIDDTRIFKLELESGKEALVEIFGIDEPKCKVSIESDEYVLKIKGEAVIESITQVINEIKIGVNRLEKQILLGKENVSLMLEFEEYDDVIYEVIKVFVGKLIQWENIASVMCWMRDLPINIQSYNFSIVSFDEHYIGVNKVYTIHDRIFKYVHINSLGEYQVDYDGVWNASHQGYIYQFNRYDNKLLVGIPQKSRMHLYIAQRYYEEVKDLVATMLGTINVINSKFDEIDQM